MPDFRIIVGDCIEGMRTLPGGSVHTCISSPPYWGLRDYGVEGQIGLEETPEQYVARMVEVYREVWRVLRDDGTCWVNLGDTYSSGGRTDRDMSGKHEYVASVGRVRPGAAQGVKPKDLVGIPWMVAFALRADGWYLRSDIIWSKPNPLPESVTDRPTKAHEYVFLLTKKPRYFYDAEAVREEAEYGYRSNFRGGGHYLNQRGAADNSGKTGVSSTTSGSDPSAGRNRRSVWHIATQPYAEAHFATYPEKLVEPMVLAGTSERGCCPECGAPWRRVTAKDRRPTRPGTGSKVNRASEHEDAPHHEQNGLIVGNRDPHRHITETRTVGWEPTCQHGREPVPCTVLDPFTGSGTTGVVACGHGRNFVGCELNPEYAAMARRRIGAVNPLLVREGA